MNCDPCKQIDCQNPEDTQTYSLESGLVFTSGVLSAIASCPVGAICPPGTFPKAYTFPEGNWTIPVPGPFRTGGGTLVLKGCQSDIIRFITPGMTSEQIAELAEAMFAEAAQQQAECDAENEPGVRRRPEAPALTMTELSPTTVCQDVAYTASVSSNNLSTTYSIIGTLPAGLVLTQANNVATIAGTPTTLGTTVFVIAATAGSETIYQQVIFKVAGISTASPLPDADIFVAYSQTLATAGTTGTVTWAVMAGTLPTGLSLNASTGEISGTPTALGTFNFTVTMTDEA